jgi:DNA ligase (NAD+)
MLCFSSNVWKKGLRFSNDWNPRRKEINMLRKFILFWAVAHLSCFAAPPAIERQARALQAVLRQADDAYYNKHESGMSDAAYDALRKQYDGLLAAFPELGNPSPVGAPVAEAGRVAHDAPVLSLDKVYSDGEVLCFLEKTGTNLLYCVEPKLDGLTVALRYRNGLLVQAVTRGDGKAGADVTSAVLASGAVPVAIATASTQFDVRGEMLLPLPAFEVLNRRRIDAGEAPLKSPRNAASGTLMLTDYAEVAARGLAFRCFELLKTDSMPLTHTEALALVKAAGLPIVENKTVPAGGVLATISDLNQRRTAFPFMTDGIVIKVDDLAACARLGATAHHPRSAVARKYEETPVQTRLLGVDWSRGETGRLTPVARFEPVEIQGATIQRATLHNMDHIRAMDLKIGDRIQVIRSGGSVPEISGVCLDLRTGNETAIPDPEE